LVGDHEISNLKLSFKLDYKNPNLQQQKVENIIFGEKCFRRIAVGANVVAPLAAVFRIIYLY
jgi:hypothetical protein